MIFERNGQESSKGYLAELASSRTNDFLKSLGLEDRVTVLEQNILTQCGEAIVHFGGLLGPVPYEIRRRIEAKIPFHFDSKVYVPVLEDREEQFYYWGEVIQDFLLYCVIRVEGANVLFERFKVDERVNDRKRTCTSKTNLWYQGKKLPAKTFSLPRLVSECWHLVSNSQLKIKYDLDEAVEQTICGLAQVYSRFASLPVLVRHFTVLDIPQEFIEGYSDQMLRAPTYPENEVDKKAEVLFKRISDHSDGSLKRGLAMVGEALKRGVRNYDKMSSSFS